MSDPIGITLPGLAEGEIAYTLPLSDTDATDVATVVVRIIQAQDPRVVAGTPSPALRIDVYQVDADGLALDGGGGLMGPPAMYVDVAAALRQASDPASMLASIVTTQRTAALERMRSYLLAQRALTTLPTGSDLPL